MFTNRRKSVAVKEAEAQMADLEARVAALTIEKHDFQIRFATMQAENDMLKREKETLMKPRELEERWCASSRPRTTTTASTRPS